MLALGRPGKADEVVAKQTEDNVLIISLPRGSEALSEKHAANI